MSKKLTSFVSLLLVAALLVAGTFAWKNFRQSMLNEWKDEIPGGTTHDDFCKPKKEVYIENWGTVPLFVRIRLDEYMEIGNGAGLKGTFNNGVWTPNPDNHSVSLLNGANINNLATWKPHIPAAIDTPNICNPSSPNFHDYWKWTMGGQKYYKKADATDRLNLAFVAQDTNDYTSITDEVGLTRNATVITMETWILLDKPIGDYWVIDKDGWAYWAAPLMPDEATGLLLRMVEYKNNVKDSYYYAINVIAQMATKYKSGSLDDDTWGNYEDFYNNMDPDHTATPEGKDLLDIITGGQSTPPAQIPATKVEFDLNEIEINVNQKYTPDYTVTPNNTTDIPVWSSSDPDIADVNPNTGEITGISEGTVTITITIGGVEDTITVIVNSNTAPQIPATGVTITTEKEITLEIGETHEPDYTVTPNNTTDIPAWSSDDTDVAIVNPNTGKITATGEGTATITVTVGSFEDTIKVNVLANELPVIPTKPPTSPNGEDYDTKTSTTVLSSNYALMCKNVKGVIERFDQNGSIKLADIINGSTAGISVSAVDPKYDGYISIGNDKDGELAIIYSYIPDISVWITAKPVTGTPVIENVELILAKEGCQNTHIKVTLRYTGSMFSNE